MIELYHYTSRFHLPYILSDGVLRTTESNVSIEQEHVGPDVVWATSEPTPARLGGHGLGSIKGGVRIGFRHGGAVRWRDWEWYGRMRPWWREAMISAGGGDAAADTWWIVAAPIPSGLWTGVAIDPTYRFDNDTMTMLDYKSVRESPDGKEALL